jgi:hypothetical protein
MNFFKLSIILGLLFVGIGDRVLPDPLATASADTRAHINQFFDGFLPDVQSFNPNRRTEEAIEALEREQ